MTNKAQGSTTIRRRPKDGSDGADAVRYWLVPSATVVKRMPDNTMTPTTLTCTKNKQTGNSIPVQTTEGTLKYEICYSSGDKTGEQNYSKAITMTSGMAWVKFILYLNGIIVASETVSVIADGNGITNVKEYYAKSSSSTTAPSKWTESVPELDSTDKYLWNYERVSYSDGTHVDTTPAVIGVFGKGISSVTNYYLATSSSSGVKTSTSGWTTAVQSPTATKRYLWNYEVISYTDNTSKTIDPHIIGVYGEAGRGISNVEEFYLASSKSSGVTTDKSEGWDTDVPSLSATNKYLWNYEKTTYTDNSTDSTPPAIIGVYGNDGKGIKSVTNYYLATSKSSGVTTAESEGWKTDVQSPTATKRYLWNYEKIEYTTGDPTTTDPHIIGVYGEQGNPGNPGNPGSPGEDGTSIILANTSKRKYTLAQWKAFHDGSHTQLDFWTDIENVAEYKKGDIIVVAGLITDYDNTECLSYWKVDSTDVSIKRVYCYATTTFIFGPKGNTGGKGDPGDKGDDAISVVVSGDSVVFKKGGGLQDAQVRVSIFKGTEKISANGACSTLQKSDGSYGTGAITSGLIWNFKMATDDSKDFLYTFTYSGGYDILRDIPFVVTVGSTKYYGNIHVCTVSDGPQGIPGKAYQPIRCREWSEISVGSKLTTGLGDSDQWTDVVYVKTSSAASGAQYWKCIKEFTKASGQTPPSDSDTTSTNALVGYLENSGANFGMLATDILLANYSLVKNLGVETIEMRDAAGNVLFLAKNGVVTCNTGTFKNINVSGDSTFRGTIYASAGEFTGKVTATSGSFNGSITAEAVNLRISTQDHNGETSPYPNGSICINATRILLPELAVGTVRTIRVLNLFMTRTSPGDLILSRGTTNVRISSTMSIMNAQATEITISECGVNSGAYIELFGFNQNGLTYWFTNITKSA